MDKRTAPWGMAIVMCLVNAVAFIDRTSLPLLVQPITRDLKISDTQMSLLIGMAFIFTYSLGGLFVGALVDRFPRRRILALGMAFWGTSTILCGTTFNYLVMFAGRLGVGLGEAAGGPACMSIIKDAFAPQQRGRAIAMWAMGAGLGAGSALLAGGTILRLVGETGSVTVPVLGTIRAWQVVLFTCGLFAFPIALLVTLLPEPARSISATGSDGVDFRSAIADMARRWQVFVPLFIANAANIMVSTGYTSWFPAYLGRVWHVPGGEIGLRLGIVVLLFNTGGQFVSGFVIDFIRRRFHPNYVTLFGVVMCAILFVPAAFIPSAPTLSVTWVMIMVEICAAASMFTIGTTTVVHLTPSHAVGKVSGIHFGWIGITGTAIAPTVVALLSDRLFGAKAESIGQALSVFGGTLAIVALLGYVLVWLALRRERALSERREKFSGEFSDERA